VAGMNYTIKFRSNCGKTVQVRIYKPLPHTGMPPELKEAIIIV
jgi:hypothetical protein